MLPGNDCILFKIVDSDFYDDNVVGISLSRATAFHQCLHPLGLLLSGPALPRCTVLLTLASFILQF